MIFIWIGSLIFAIIIVFIITNWKDLKEEWYYQKYQEEFRPPRIMINRKTNTWEIKEGGKRYYDPKD